MKTALFLLTRSWKSALSVFYFDAAKFGTWDD